MNTTSTRIKRILQRNRQALISTVLLCLASGAVSADTTDPSSVTLTLNRQAGTSAEHRVKMKSSISQGDVLMTTVLDATYSEYTTQHEDGLLVRRENIDTRNTGFESSPIEPSMQQQLILQLQVLAMVSTPDHLITPQGEFIRLPDFESFKASHMTLIESSLRKNLFENSPEFNLEMLSFLPVEEMTAHPEMFISVIEEHLEKQRDLDGMILVKGKPVKKDIISNVSNSGEKKLISGNYSYHGTVPCNQAAKNSTEVLCADIRFVSEKTRYEELNAEVQITQNLLIEPETLQLHYSKFDMTAGDMLTIQQLHEIEYSN